MEEIAIFPAVSTYVEKVVTPPLSGMVLTQENACIRFPCSGQGRFDGRGLPAKINAYGKSKQQGLIGVGQALLQALYQQFPHKKMSCAKPIQLVLKEDCQGKTGLLQITTEPAAAQVVIDGVLQGQTRVFYGNLLQDTISWQSKARIPNLAGN